MTKRISLLRKCKMERLVFSMLASFAYINGTSAAPILDQQFDATGGGASQAIYSGQSLAQTFTVGVDGRLDSVGLMLSRYEPTTSGDFTLSLASTLGGVPDTSSSVLFLQTYSVYDVGYEGAFNYSYTDFDLSSANLFVSAGQQLAMVVSHEGGNDNWMTWDSDSRGGTYPGGQGMYSNGLCSEVWCTSPGYITDRGFRTYVDSDVAPISEPGTLALLTLSLLGLVGVRYRRS